MAARLLRTPPPAAAKAPTRRAVFLVCAGSLSVVAAAFFAFSALTTPKRANGADPGRIAAGLAGGGVFAASLGAPALKRQSQAREALARWAKERGFSLVLPDEARGVLDDVPLGVRIVYGRGPYAARGASELCVIAHPDTPEAAWLGDSEPFDDVAVIDRHIERLAQRVVRAVRPPEEA